MKGILYKMRWPCPCNRASLSAILIAGVASAVVIGLHQGQASSAFGTSENPGEVIPLEEILSATESVERAVSLETDRLSRIHAELRAGSPMWPVFTFLVAEVYRLRGDAGRAYEMHRGLVEWAVDDPYDDGWGGSGLAVIALLRCTQTLRTDPDPDGAEVRSLIELARRLMETRLTRRMLDTPVLSTLPQLEESILRDLALLAWSVESKDVAERLFLDYLMVSTTAELGREETDLMNHVVSSGLASLDHLVLLRGKRLCSLKRFDEARKFLNDSRKSRNPAIRAEAGYRLARLTTVTDNTKDEIISTLTSVIEDAADPVLAQEALFYRAIVYNREGTTRGIEQFLEDLMRLVKTFPKGQRADDALYEIARHYENEIEPNVEQATLYFEKLRAFEGPNDWINLAYFRPALALYTRGGQGDISTSTQLLRNLVDMNRFGPLRLPALFWLGRIAAEQGEEKSSRRYFREVIAESPYDYYAIRARMHLNIGKAASTELMPDPTTRQELREAFEKSKIETSLTGDSPYHRRLRDALQTGLYSASLSADRRLREQFPSLRLEEVSLQELDEALLLTPVSLLLSLRQDAAAAVDKVPESGNRLQVASAVGHGAGDWPLSMTLVLGLGEPVETLWDTQQDEHYLAAAYPPVYAELLVRAGAAREVPSELLYSIIRRESLFHPVALSERGALGVFQFMPYIFDNLNEQWGLLGSTTPPSIEAFLCDPELSIDLGARWFKEELLKHAHAGGDTLLAIMEHNAGRPAVSDWLGTWEMRGRNGDIEYMIETARFAQTRIFARSVLTDMAIADAAGILKPH